MTESLTDLLTDALLRWEEAKQKGLDLTPQQLCPDRPEAWPEIVRILATSPLVVEMLDTSHDSKPSGVVPPKTPEIPGYEIERILGRGGMSVVYLARQSKLKRRVALKVLRVMAYVDDDERARFRAEIKANARLQHSNVVQIYEAGEVGNAPYLALEYVEGGNLREKLVDGPLPPATAAEIVRTLAEAVQAAHAAGIIHRDLKPANVLLTATGQPKIGDFGLAKLRALEDADTFRAGTTRSGAILGTPAYMSPEQAAGHTTQIGPLSDIYGLGAILYECLTGRPPYQAASFLDLLDLIRKGDPPTPRFLQPRLPADLDTICMKCLSREPGRRYASAQDLAEDLRRHQLGVPIQARPVGWIERTWKFSRRNAVLVGATTATVLALALGLIGVTTAFVLQQRAQQRADKSESDRRRADAESFVQLAKVQMLSGRWEDALYWIERALFDGVADPLVVRLLRCQALLALNRAESADELRTLQQQAENRPELVAQLKLMHGELLLGRDDAAAERLMREAYSSGRLDEVDRAYVDGVLAPNSQQLIDKLEFVVRRQPHRLRANLILGFTYVCLGRKEDFRLAAERIQTLHPDDSFVAVLHALIAALESRQTDVEKHLDRASLHLQPDQFRVLNLVCLLVARLSKLDELLHKDQQVVASEISAVAFKSMFAKPRPGGSAEMQHPFPIPYYLKKHLAPLLQLMPIDKLDLSTMQQLKLTFGDSRSWVKFIVPLQQLTAVHPEGVMLLLQAMSLREAGRWHEADAAINECLRRPALFRIGNYATSVAIEIWHHQATQGSGFGRLAAHAKASAALHSLPVTQIPIWLQVPLIPKLIDLREWDLARILIRSYLRDYPNDRQGKFALANLLHYSGSNEEALAIFEQLQKNANEAERKHIDFLVRNIRAALRKAVENQPKPP